MAHAVACVRQWVEMQLRAPIGHTSVSAATPDSSYAISACACLEPLDAQSQPLAHIAGGTAQRASSRLLQLHTRGLTYNVGLPGQFLAGVFRISSRRGSRYVRGCPQSIVDATRQMVHVSVSYGYGASHTLHPWSCTWRLVLRHNITRTERTSVCFRPLPALASPDSARSSRTTRGLRGAGGNAGERATRLLR